MQPEEELKIEYKRLKRHVNNLSKRYSPAVSRDMSACLRNWVQLAATIDATAETNAWHLTFTKATVTKASKTIRSKGENLSIPLSASVSSKNMQIGEVQVYNRALSQDEIKKLYEVGKSSRPSLRSMKFEVWLNSSAYQANVQGVKQDISRRIFIDRAANLLGGTHPVSNFVETEHSTWADPYIVELLNTYVGLWPAPYAILMESSQELLRAFKPYLD